MENNISRITNAYIKVPEFKINEDGKQEEKNTKQKEKQAEENNKQMAPADVLGLLAAQNVDKQLSVEKLADKIELKARIEDYLGNFEEMYGRVLSAILEEFPELTEDAAGKIALAYLNASF